MNEQTRFQTCLDRLITQLDHKLSARPAGEGLYAWAHDLCAWSREAHIETWDAEPDEDFVERQVIPMFHKAEKAIRSVPPTDEHKTLGYADNVSARIENLWRYVRNEPSAFDEDEPDPAKLADQLAR